ncbi:MAG: amidohydrolase family protein [Synergistaceae bacterium]|jgi:imidazolonepropionase-like amidohydrolase|nr:amidohydrolase family protein [Synergistaceae bacterium]
MKHIIVCGKLFDGKRDELLEGVEIRVEDNIITEVGQNLSRTPETDVIDLSHLTVTPGMIDAHVHSDIFRWQKIWDIVTRSATWCNLGHLHTAQRSLERGFTTIRCHALGDPGYGVVDVKKAIEAGYFHGSRMVVACHMIGTVGSHADFSQIFSENPNLANSAQNPAIGAGADFFRDVVRKEAKFGGDFIKLFMSGGFSTPNDGPEDQQLSDDEAEAIISTARQLRKPTTAHVYAPPLMQKLIKLGITGMEHGAMMDAETAAMFEETDTYLVPTFCPYEEIIDLDEANLAKKPEFFQKKLRHYAEILKKGREIIVKSNIRLGYGTDFVAVHECYESWYEYRSWMRSGMDPFRILKAATSVNAGILEIDDKIGSIEPGKLADIAGWPRDLLHDEDALSECGFVMKNGVVYPTYKTT